MIASLRGTLAVRDVSGVVVEVAGVGYQLEVPLGTFERLPAIGATVHLHTELVVREDLWQLYGFDTPADRLVFRRLLGAAGVGARLALAVLSTLGADRAVQAIRSKDLAVLASVPGIGRKKAERLALELSDRLDDIPLTVGVPVAASPASEASRALQALGYSAAAADAAVRTVAEALPRADTALLVRRALTELSRS
jgi:Holliday junction DNA helicase RuvA